ncbi:hypothetical protein ACQJBY_006016 [Aegilops geniculata]
MILSLVNYYLCSIILVVVLVQTKTTTRIMEWSSIFCLHYVVAPLSVCSAMVACFFSQLHYRCYQEMEATCYVTVDDNHYAYFDQVDKLSNYGAHNNETLSSLLWAFFHYWAYQHDYTQNVISIRTGKIISKHMKDWTRRVGNDRHLICIEDPFETSHDLGRIVDKFSIKILREEFERAANILQYDPNPSVKLFEPYVPPPPSGTLDEEGILSTAGAII